ncbi:MAG: peroxiredoxin [Deltaproteobacteria bacterium]|nr:peroxiredoxin [Candidatus Zymogenaceae bacterium]
MKLDVIIRSVVSLLAAAVFVVVSAASGAGAELEEYIYDPGVLPATDSVLKVAVGDEAPDFTLPSIAGSDVTLGDYRGKKNVVLSFVPAAWTPVCSDQWPGYVLAVDLFREHNAVLIGITVDNIPTLFAWTQEMGEVWFDVVSDFWPHGEVAETYGVLRRDGTSERALFLIDTEGIIRYIDVHDINERPDLGDLKEAMEAL